MGLKINPITITVYKIGKNFVIDPVKGEEDVSEAKLSIGMSDGFIFSMQKGMEKGISMGDLEKMINMAEKAWKDLNSKFENIK